MRLRLSTTANAIRLRQARWAMEPGSNMPRGEITTGTSARRARRAAAQPGSVQSPWMWTRSHRAIAWSSALPRPCAPKSRRGNARCRYRTATPS